MSTPELTYHQLAAGVTAFSTTRRGGVSQGSHGSLNVNAYCGDEPASVAQNRRLLSEALGLSGPERLVMPHQVHGTAVRHVDAGFLALPADRQAALLEGVDALMTREAEVCIGVSTADCIPVLVYDPVQRAACAIHAGWRGTVARIAVAAVREMAQAFGSRPADLKAVIGPGISLRNFEVGQEVYDQFAQAGFDMAAVACRRQKWHIDLPLCNRMQLEACGVGGANILSCGICTYDSVSDYFSARRLGIDSGRIFSGIVIHHP